MNTGEKIGVGIVLLIALGIIGAAASSGQGQGPAQNPPTQTPPTQQPPSSVSTGYCPF